jgi:predicted PurR-regulated permease PerM
MIITIILFITVLVGWCMVAKQLIRIFDLLENIQFWEEIMSEWMNTISAAVERNTALDESIITLLDSIVSKILDTAGDKEKALELAAELDNKSNALAAAILANTAPVEPPVEPPIE